MKAYCINLERRSDRLQYISSVFAAQNIVFERISACDGLEPSVAAEASQCKPAVDGSKISAGAYGCFLSHRQAWRCIVASKDQWGMVFEDDVFLAPGLSTYLNDGWVPGGADLIKMETYGRRIHLARGAGLKAGARSLHRLRSFNKGTGGYVISAAAAARVLALSATIDRPVDDFLFDVGSPGPARGMVIYQMLPAPVIQGDRVPVEQRPSWSITSIRQRIEAVGPQVVMRPKSRLQHWRDRLIEEGRAILNGTRYTRLPFG